jgi:hypothetical protein
MPVSVYANHPSLGDVVSPVAPWPCSVSFHARHGQPRFGGWRTTVSGTQRLEPIPRAFAFSGTGRRQRRDAIDGLRRGFFTRRLSAVNTPTCVGPQNDSCRATRATFMGLCSETVPGKRASRLPGARCVFPRHGRPWSPAAPRAGAGSPRQFRERPFPAPPTPSLPRHRPIAARRADARVPAFRRRTPHPGSRMRGTSA